MFIDWAHEFYDGMPGFRYKNDDGTVTQFRVEIHPFLTHAQTRPRYDGKAEFEITEMKFHTSMGTYLDAPQYEAYPFHAREVIDELIARGAKLVGVDTLNIDDTRDPERPAHTRLLQNDILIVENLCHLDALHGKAFRFFAAPLRARGAAAMQVRAFAELTRQ